jgi:hypothetical protein
MSELQDTKLLYASVKKYRKTRKEKKKRKKVQNMIHSMDSLTISITSSQVPSFFQTILGFWS